MSRIVILTQEFPYGKGESFLMPEVEWMIRSGLKVFLIPYKWNGNPRPLPPEVTVFNPSIVRNQVVSGSVKVIHADWFWKEIILHPGMLFRTESRQSILFFLKMLVVTQFRLELFYKSHQLSDSDILYSYWLSGLTGGALKFREGRSEKVRVISRAHGGDLYEFRYASNYLPFRNFLLSKVDYVALVSKNGWRYLSERYSNYKSKMAVNYLGINDPGFLCEKSSDTIVRVVSCSYISPVKRIPFLIDVLKYIVDKHPLLRLNWNHIGGGEGLTEVRLYAQKQLTTENIQWTLLEDLPNHEVMRFYKEHPVDVFVSVSTSEGIPVSMMEAMSVGIPVVSTHVGGVTELVGEDRVIDSHVSIANFGDFLLNKISKSASQNDIKALWAERFDASKTYAQFVNKIQTDLIQSFK